MFFVFSVLGKSENLISGLIIKGYFQLWLCRCIMANICSVWMAERIHHAQCMAAKAKKKALKKTKTAKSLTAVKVNLW